MSCEKKIKNNELLELIAWGRAELSRAGIEEAQEECERILMKFLACSRSAVYLEEHALGASGVREKFLEIIEKRISRVPLAYLLKEADFWKETLFVDQRCLIPRPETEILVERIILEVKKQVTVTKKGTLSDDCPPKGDCHLSFLDVGTGSGAIAIALLREFPEACGTLLDISEGALEVAEINLEKYGLMERAILVQGDVFSSFPPFAKGGKGGSDKSPPAPLYERGGRLGEWDLIVSNPPYLSEADWKDVQEELKFEPKDALDGGKGGLDFYRKIITGAEKHLSPGGLLALEVGQGQSGMVSKWLQDAGYVNIQRFQDHLGIERVVIAREKDENSKS